MPKSKSKSKSKPKLTSKTYPLYLEHLYDAFTHPIAHTSGFWGPVTLPFELVPRVASFLDPRGKAEDLAALLVIQRCSTFAWECVTPRMYEDVTVVDWTKFLRLPKGLVFPTMKQITSPRHCTNAAHIRSLKRRRLAFRSIIAMTIHSFPTAGDYQAFRHLTWKGKEKTPCDNKGHERCDRMFPELLHLEISERAMEPICHGGIFADRWIDNPQSGDYEKHEICDFLIGSDAHIHRGCIMLPQKQEHTMAYGLNQLIQGNAKYGAPSTSGMGNGMQVVPERTEDSTVLRDVLGVFARGATVSIHNMTDLWIRMACGHNSVYYRLFYSPDSVRVPSTHGGGLVIYRKGAYFDTLRCEPEFDPCACKDCGKDHFRATWTITGEEYCHEDQSHAAISLHNMVFDLCEDLLNEDLEDEVEMFDEEEAEDVELQYEILAGVAPGVKAKLKRMKFVAPGEEVPCSFCGRF